MVASSVPVGAIIGGVVGGFALILCIIVFVILIRRIHKVEQQSGAYELSHHGDKDIVGAPNTVPVVVERSESYGAPQALRYPEPVDSGNLQRRA